VLAVHIAVDASSLEVIEIEVAKVIVCNLA
jgi:hypothetical protein